MLQWGRNLIVAEGQTTYFESMKGDCASMGPQLDSCGRYLRTEATTAGAKRLQWGRNLIVAEGTTIGAGPTATAWLQWGRNLIVAEGVAGWAAYEKRQDSFNGAAT